MTDYGHDEAMGDHDTVQSRLGYDEDRTVDAMSTTNHDEGGHATSPARNGRATASGYYGHATASGYYGHATASGYCGYATASGYGGTASAGEDGTICIAWRDGKSSRRRVAVGYVGEDGIKPDTAYQVVDGVLVEVGDEGAK